MLFHSAIFWVFLAVVLVLHASLRPTQRTWMLLVASYVFYGFWDWRFLSLILVSTITDYVVARRIQTNHVAWQRRVLLGISITTNLGLLGFFKYFNFFAEQMTTLLGAIGAAPPAVFLDIVLPVGISFYTFQTMSYTIDVYQGKISATRRPVAFALFVSFFPQLVAGPIERASRLLPQVISPRVRTRQDFRFGLYHVLHGLFLKVVVADNMASLANTVFGASASDLSAFDVLVGVYAFAFQIYGDFAGYSSIARGVARWLGYDLMVNFRMPYLATSPSDFWRRWHISLSTWLRDYLYIPLGGNRGSVRSTYRNLLVTMLLGGLWHGAAWTFVIWGAFHGAILALHRWFAPLGAGSQEPPTGSMVGRFVARVAMFHLVCVGWLFFRADSLAHAWALVGRLVTDPTVTPFALGSLAFIAFFVAPLLLYEAWLEHKQDVDAIVTAPWPLRGLVYSYLILFLVFFPAQTQYEFIYFQF